MQTPARLKAPPTPPTRMKSGTPPGHTWASRTLPAAPPSQRPTAIASGQKGTVRTATATVTAARSHQSEIGVVLWTLVLRVHRGRNELAALVDRERRRGDE